MLLVLRSKRFVTSKEFVIYFIYFHRNVTARGLVLPGDNWYRFIPQQSLSFSLLLVKMELRLQSDIPDGTISLLDGM